VALFGSEVSALLVGMIMALCPVFVFSVTPYHALNVYILPLLLVFDLTLSRGAHTYTVSWVLSSNPRWDCVCEFLARLCSASGRFPYHRCVRDLARSVRGARSDVDVSTGYINNRGPLERNRC
jgi:hypothetical protein